MVWRAFLHLLAACLLSAPLVAAGPADTPAQDRALDAWHACTTGPTTARLDRIDPNGRIHFHYSGPSERARMTACLREKRMEFRSSPKRETGKTP
jgi:hypothetical protein